jgi:pantoate--beta-alanine ligase
VTEGPAILRAVAALRAQVAAWRSEGQVVALVPTMGALHSGHLTLVHNALALCTRVVVTIFVNPAQFGPNEDFARYPRQESVDAGLAGQAGAHLIYAPGAEEMYPDGFRTTVGVGGPLGQVLDAAHRPGHFEGVATVVAKLLLQALPDAAFFGEKDWQQLQVIRRMTTDLDIPVRIHGVPTVREPDGLALSSRNTYLTTAERASAASLPHILHDTAVQIAAGAPVEPALASARARLLRAGFEAVDYVELADPTTLAPLRRADRPGRLLAAARIGRTRLIDNLAVG